MPRRTLLQAGALGTLGLALPGLQRAAMSETSGTLPGFGRAKRCIFLFMWGGPSQLETFDLKPAAPAEIRGEFQPIATSVPGVQIGEHLRNMAGLMDRVAVIRSLTHDDPSHLASAHCTLTGQLAPVVKSDAEPPSERDTPHLGSVMARLRPATTGMPPFVTMPWLAYHPWRRAAALRGSTAAGWAGRTTPCCSQEIPTSRTGPSPRCSSPKGSLWTVWTNDGACCVRWTSSGECSTPGRPRWGTCSRRPSLC